MSTASFKTLLVQSLQTSAVRKLPTTATTTMTKNVDIESANFAAELIIGGAIPPTADDAERPMSWTSGFLTKF